MAAQVPALFEALSGMDLKELFANVRSIGDKSPKAVAAADAAKVPIKPTQPAV
jgi:ribosomal protein L12E/L44/L45/RPP1/RPP2